MSIKSVTIIPHSPNQPGKPCITPENIMISGNPSALIWNCFESENNNVMCGLWESEAFCKHKVHINESEFCYLLEGHVTLTDSDGESLQFSAGDAFVIEPGFNGTWESKTNVKKIYVISKCV